MERKLDMRGGGTLTLRLDGTRVQLDAVRPRDDRGLYKVWLLGQRGGRMLLGTMAPEGNVLRLRRTISQGELERAGCWPAAGAEASGVCARAAPSRGITSRAASIAVSSSFFMGETSFPKDGPIVFSWIVLTV